MASMVGYLIGVMVAIIVLVAVVLPTVKTVVSDQSLTGAAKTIGDLFPLLLIVGALLLVVSIYRS